jgi:hypothetical protein
MAAGISKPGASAGTSRGRLISTQHRVSNGKGESIRGVNGRERGETQQDEKPSADVGLGRVPVPRDDLLDPARLVLGDGDTCPEGLALHEPPDLPEHDGGVWVPVDVAVLERESIGLELGEDFLDVLAQREQAGIQRVRLAHLEHAALDVHRPLSSLDVDHPVPTDTRAGVDPKDAHGLDGGTGEARAPTMLHDHGRVRIRDAMTPGFILFTIVFLGIAMIWDLGKRAIALQRERLGLSEPEQQPVPKELVAAWEEAGAGLVNDKADAR